MGKTVFFDLGNVLIFFSHKRMCRQLSDVLSLKMETVYDFLFKSTLADDYELGKISTNDLYNQLTSLTKNNVPYFDVLHAVSNIFQPNPAIIPLLEKLKAKGTKLVILSNTCEAHYNYASSHFPHLKLFDDKILSYEVGLRKPDPNIFNRAILKAKTTVDDCFYTDDMKENVRAAKRLGIKSHTFTSTELLEEELKKLEFI